MDKRANVLKALVGIGALALLIAGAWFGYRAIGDPAQSTAKLPAAASAAADEKGDDGSAGTRADANEKAEKPSSNKVPSFTVSEPSGEKRTLESIVDGKYTLVNFWATWCPYCVRELGSFQAAYERYGDRMNFAMVNASDSPKEVNAARAYVEKSGNTFPVYLDLAHEAFANWGVRSLPMTVILNGQGEPVAVHTGQISEKALMEKIEQVLGQE
ncbi:TlpA family protein disulfide reductase [Berryella wangjianweii]|uniref:TlpA family protein disulfide reductase n=1 Tax=Berryella wangjianweii TaxID=2734634 RepID=A0A6M8J988_9ACTN|nr:TlpA disulfide reductase family protein [Berryella wangjianweii]NPD32035.1 TlpA family protein disulfide reductase [Eggerthellaceae bacterium zg-997]QKF07382.1 TlpA family protein disulfide reductase [Berryella wangjianweii]